MSDAAPPVLPVGDILERIRRAIPAELDPRGFATRELAAKTIFVMLYGGAIEGADRWIRPTAVTDMTDEQAARQDDDEGARWLDRVQGFPRPHAGEGRWYGENTREPIRDETIRQLIQLGAIVERANVPTTSPKPRYALAEHFAALFAPGLAGGELDEAIEDWQQRHLSREQRARLALSHRGSRPSEDRPLVTLPNGETRRLAAGPSSALTKSVVESFAPRFLRKPAVVVISESARKLTYTDQQLAHMIGFDIDVGRTLPDVVLADLEEPLLIVFVECVVSDGEVNAGRKEELEEMARRAKFDPAGCAFVTAFPDRVRSRYRSLSTSLAWGSFAWFASEPDDLLHLFSHRYREIDVPLAAFLRLGHHPGTRDEE